MEFLDVTGASGRAYRFRSVSLEHLPATAGNLILTTGAQPRLGYRLCAAARSLNRAVPAVREALAGASGARLFIRLNVSRAAREDEHADIVAALSPELDLPDLD
jgi:hypothetical protein